MTGVPDQSQTCRNCRVSRIACDRARPVCTPCRRSGFQCVGPGRKIIFVNTTAPALRNGDHAVAGAVQPQSSDSLCRYADEQKYIGFFWSSYLPGGERCPHEASRYTTYGWTNVAQTLGDRVEVVKLALSANSLCMLGSQHREARMVKEGQLLYGRALKKMRHALQTFSESEKDGLIVASRLLTMFMVLFGADQNDKVAQTQAWAALNAGEMALFLSCKPVEYQNGAAHQLFVDARLHLFIPSIVTKARSVLENVDWMTIPWSDIPKTPLDHLVDLVAEIPRLLEDLRCPGTQETGLVQCLALVAQLESWFDKISPELGVDEVLRSSDALSSASDLAKTHVLVLFWAICLLLRHTLLDVLPETQLSSRFHLHVLRQNILKALPIFFRPEAGWCGVNIAVFPLRVVFDTLDEFPLSHREEKSMTRLLDQYKGKEVLGFLHSMTQYRSELSESR